MALRLTVEGERSATPPAAELERRRLQAEADERLARQLLQAETEATVGSARQQQQQQLEADSLVAQRLAREWAEAEQAVVASNGNSEAKVAAGPGALPATAATRAAPGAGVRQGRGPEEERSVPVPHRCIGYLCGRHMASIRQLESETRTRITVPERNGAAVAHLIVRGATANVAQAESVILGTVSRCAHSLLLCCPFFARLFLSPRCYPE